jgi:hypothetical protein
MAAATGRRALLALAAAAALLPAAPARAAEVSFVAEVDQREVAMGELVTLRVRLEALDEPTQWESPSSKDFDVVAQGSAQEISTSSAGGSAQVHRVVTLLYQLRPKQPGAMTIPALTAVVQGKKYVTQPIVVKVAAAGKRPNSTNTPSAGAPGGGAAQAPGSGPRGRWAYNGWEKDVAVRMELTKREVYLGEQLTADAWLVGPSEMRFGPKSMPSYDGFWREEVEIPPSLRPTSRGDQWAYLLTRSALFPTRTGELTLEPVQGTVEVLLRGNAYSAFGEVVQVERGSEPVTVRVKPLPPDAPPGFDRGNVGSLTLSAEVAPERVAVGEPVTLRVTVSGDGNVRAIVPPRLPALSGARAYQPATTDRSEVRDGRIYGTRTVETVIVPDRAGTLVLPSLEWPYFDPRAGKYQVAITPALQVTVDPAGAAPRAAARGADALDVPLRPIRADGALHRIGPPPWRHPWFLALLLVPPLAFLAAAGAERLRAGGAGARAIGAAARQARRRLAAARRKRARDPRGAAAEVERALLGYAGARLGRPAAGLTREALASELARAGAHAPAVRALLQALELVDAARYGAGDVHAEELLTGAERALEALEEADWQQARGVGS